jgi:Family of unknown function (DUF6308)
MPEDRPIVVRRLDGGPSLIIEDASSLAFAFFSRDPSSIGPMAFDERAGHGDPYQITTDDIRAINQTMRARSPHTAWEALTSAGPLPWLAALDPSWDLVELPDREWERFGCTALLEATFAAAIAPHGNLAVAMKVLHLKRPSLFPVLDLLVVQQVGGVGRPPIALLLHLRTEAQRNRLALHRVQTNLRKAHITRTLIRILDALLWSSHPGAGIAALAGWERVIRPASRGAPGTDADRLGPGA